jgi:hypothetical protein
MITGASNTNHEIQFLRGFLCIPKGLWVPASEGLAPSRRTHRHCLPVSPGKARHEVHLLKSPKHFSEIIPPPHFLLIDTEAAPAPLMLCTSQNYIHSGDHSVAQHPAGTPWNSYKLPGLSHIKNSNNDNRPHWKQVKSKRREQFPRAHLSNSRVWTLSIFTSALIPQNNMWQMESILSD